MTKSARVKRYLWLQGRAVTCFDRRLCRSNNLSDSIASTYVRYIAEQQMARGKKEERKEGDASNVTRITQLHVQANDGNSIRWMSGKRLCVCTCYRSTGRRVESHHAQNRVCVAIFLHEGNSHDVAPTRWPLTIEKRDETDSRQGNHSDRGFEISRDDESQLSSFDSTGARACRTKLSHLGFRRSHLDWNEQIDFDRPLFSCLFYSIQFLFTRL